MIRGNHLAEFASAFRCEIGRSFRAGLIPNSYRFQLPYGARPFHLARVLLARISLHAILSGAREFIRPFLPVPIYFIFLYSGSGACNRFFISFSKTQCNSLPTSDN